MPNWPVKDHVGDFQLNWSVKDQYPRFPTFWCFSSAVERFVSVWPHEGFPELSGEKICKINVWLDTGEDLWLVSVIKRTEGNLSLTESGKPVIDPANLPANWVSVHFSAQFSQNLALVCCCPVKISKFCRQNNADGSSNAELELSETLMDFAGGSRVAFQLCCNATQERWRTFRRQSERWRTLRRHACARRFRLRLCVRSVHWDVAPRWEIFGHLKSSSTIAILSHVIQSKRDRNCVPETSVRGWAVCSTWSIDHFGNALRSLVSLILSEFRNNLPRARVSLPWSQNHSRSIHPSQFHHFGDKNRIWIIFENDWKIRAKSIWNRA
jgi:hypothetical protein